MDLTKKRKLDENGLAVSDFELSIADARKIIEPFTHDQLLDIVQNAILRHLDVLNAVRSIADRDPAQRKLFIRGLGWDTTNEKLASIFSTYGELEEAVVILDKATGKSKGFGFVTFKHIDGALRALKEPSKKIDGRMTVTNLAAAGLSVGAGGAPVQPQAMDVSMRKIYVANVPHDMPGERLLAHFLSYGEIEEGPLGFDKATGKSKGFALFVYKTADAARASLVDPIKTIDGHQLNCKLAIDGKRGKPPGHVGVSAESHGNGIGLLQTGVVPGSAAATQFGGPGGVGGITGYGGGFSGGLQGPSPRSQHPLNSSFTSPGVGGPGLSSLATSQAPTSMGMGVSGGYGSGIVGPYSGSHYSGPGSTGYGGLVGAGSRMGGVVGGLGGTGSGIGGLIGGLGGAGLGGAASGMGGSAAGLSGAAAGLGGPGRMSALYGLQPNPVGLGLGGYSESAHYSLSGGSGYQSQHHQMTGASPATRVPHSGIYPPHY